MSEITGEWQPAEIPLEAPPDDGSPEGKSAAATVAAGIFTSRIIGFVRERAVAHFFGVGALGDVWQVAFRGPNILQNLLGEGTISASFIPIYSRMIAEGREEEAGRFAGAIFGLLLAVAGTMSLLGILLAEPIVTIFAPGWLNDAAEVARGDLSIDRFELSVRAVKIIFPMTGILVLSAWCLGVLNSHRRFFLPYFAPVLWNIAIIAGLSAAAYVLVSPEAGVRNLEEVSTDFRVKILFAGCIGALAGGALQSAIQLPLVFRLLKGFRVSISTRVIGVRNALSSFLPVVFGRGVFQLSTYFDMFLASYLIEGAVSSLRYAQMLYVLPVSLFGLSIAASELPELARFRSEETRAFMRRLNRSLSQMLFMTIPTLFGYLIFGFLIVGAIFRTGEFGIGDSWLVYLVLAAYSLGLLATTISRLLQNAFYALNDTKTPARVAVVRVVISAVVAVPLMLLLDRYSVADVTGVPPTDNLLYLGSVGLAVGTSIGAWIELRQLRRHLRQKVDVVDLPWGPIRRMSATAAGAALPSMAIWWILPEWHVALQALIVVGAYGGAYLGVSAALRAPEMEAWAGRLFRR
ncbi:MAG: murein biosynthesis integral membrane protein MurJ [Rhodothermales bacterium]